MSQDQEIWKRIYFWKCPHLKKAYRGLGPYCSLHKTEFGNCNSCAVYKESKRFMA